jgi:hypothetical protein
MDGDSRQDETAPVRCGQCRHYYVTWDAAFPHGCRAMGFKSRIPPALEVRSASGLECQMYAGKERKGGVTTD